MGISDLDFCTLCGGYDTIQTYFEINKEKHIWIHVCEKCARMGKLNVVLKAKEKFKNTILTDETRG